MSQQGLMSVMGCNSEHNTYPELTCHFVPHGGLLDAFRNHLQLSPGVNRGNL